MLVRLGLCGLLVSGWTLAGAKKCVREAHGGWACVGRSWTGLAVLLMWVTSFKVAGEIAEAFVQVPSLARDGLYGTRLMPSPPRALTSGLCAENHIRAAFRPKLAAAVGQDQ